MVTAQDDYALQSQALAGADMIKADALLTVASIIAGFGVTVFMFRLQRELQVFKEKEKTWLPVADWLVIGAVLVTLALVFSLLMRKEDANSDLTAQRAWCAVAIVLLAGYIPSILAHYNFLFWLRPSRGWYTRSEVAFVVVTVVAASLAYGWVMFDAEMAAFAKSWRQR